MSFNRNHSKLQSDFINLKDIFFHSILLQEMKFVDKIMMDRSGYLLVWFFCYFTMNPVEQYKTIVSHKMHQITQQKTGSKNSILLAILQGL